MDKPETNNHFSAQFRIPTEELAKTFQAVAQEYVNRLCELWDVRRSDCYWISDQIGDELDIFGEFALSFPDIRYFVDHCTSFEDFEQWNNYNVDEGFKEEPRFVNRYSWFNLGWRPGCDNKEEPSVEGEGEDKTEIEDFTDRMKSTFPEIYSKLEKLVSEIMEPLSSDADNSEGKEDKPEIATPNNNNDMNKEPQNNNNPVEETSATTVRKEAEEPVCAVCADCKFFDDENNKCTNKEGLFARMKEMSPSLCEAEHDCNKYEEAGFTLTPLGCLICALEENGVHTDNDTAQKILDSFFESAIKAGIISYHEKISVCDEEEDDCDEDGDCIGFTIGIVP